jgi:hypothetical protein
MRMYAMHVLYVKSSTRCAYVCKRGRCLAGPLFLSSALTYLVWLQVYGAQIGLPVQALMLGAVFNRVVGGFAALAWLGVAQFADARLCFMGCIMCTIVAIAVCAWMSTVTDFYIVVLTMTTASSGSFIFAKVRGARARAWLGGVVLWSEGAGSCGVTDYFYSPAILT